MSVQTPALGADAVAIASAARQAIGCVGMAPATTTNVPSGSRAHQAHPRARVAVDEAADRLARDLGATVELMCVLARACGHRHLRDFSPDDLTAFDREMAHLCGIPYGGATPA